MIIKKILKTLLLFSFIGGAAFIFIWGELSDKRPASNIILHDFGNNASKIKYITKTKGGIISIESEKIIFLPKNTIKLYNIKAIYQTKNKQISVNAGECRYFIEDKKVCLYNNVNIISDSINIHTDNAIVNIEKQNIRSKSKTVGMSNGMRFESNGFFVVSDGRIHLVKPKFNLSVQNTK